MDHTIGDFTQWGIAGCLIGCIIWYTRYLAFEVLPKVQQAHIEALVRAHHDCEDKLTSLTEEYVQDRLQRQREVDKTIAQLAKQIANCETKINLIHPRNQE